jgi:putative membrane protein
MVSNSISGQSSRPIHWRILGDGGKRLPIVISVAVLALAIIFFSEWRAGIVSVYASWFGVDLTLVPVLVAGTVLLFLIGFVVHYLIPGVRLWFELNGVSKRLREVKNDDKELMLDDLSNVFSRSDVMAHLWSEYRQTLHPQFVIRDGEKVIERIRATVPAEGFFSSQAAVDSRIGAEFFRHLPGILTGIGIIGTFAGLVEGLMAFNMDLDPAKLGPALTSLIASVKEAFIASGTAILVAMVITLLEKVIVAANYHALEEVVQGIDALYDAGAGEEYLSRLVRSSEESATQTRQLKDSLVEDLKTLLSELTNRQVLATQQAFSGLSQSIGESIADNLKEPLGKIAEVVETASGSQGQAVHGMLENLLSAFMAKLDDTIGDQMKGLSSMMAESANGIREMQAGFQHLMEDFAKAGDTASRSMADQLANMMADAEARQQRMAEAMTQSIEQLQARMTGGQEQLHDQMAAGVQGIREAVSQMLGDMAEQRRHAVESSNEDARRLQDAMADMLAEVRKASATTADRFGEEITGSLEKVQSALGSSLDALALRQQEADERSKSLLDGLDQRLTSMIDAVTGAGDAMRESTHRLSAVSLQAIEGMNRGADTMRQAADGFTTAGNVVAGAVTKGSDLFEQVSVVSKGLETTALTMRDTVAAYAQTRGSLEAMAETLKAVAQDADQRAGVSRALVADMEALVAQFADAERHSRDYLQQVTEVVSEAFGRFNASVYDSLDKNRGAFDASLSNAVKMLSEQIVDLEGALSDFRSKLAA